MAPTVGVVQTKERSTKYAISRTFYDPGLFICQFQIFSPQTFKDLWKPCFVLLRHFFSTATCQTIPSVSVTVR